MSESAYEGFAVVEVMGHRRVAGYVREVTLAGAPMLRVDIPAKDAGSPPKLTQFYGGASIFCLTPTTEETARREANPPEFDWAPYQLSAGDNASESEPDE